MKSWKLNGLGGALRLEEVPIPAVRAGAVRVRIQASLLMSYLREYVAGALPAYSAPQQPFTPGGNCIGIVDMVGADVWHLHPGQRVAVSPHFVAQENVASPAQFLLGVTAFGTLAKQMQSEWPDGTLAEYVTVPAHLVTPLYGVERYDAAQLTFLLRYAVPYGGLLRGRMQAGETVLINGASGAYGTAAVLLALALGASRVIAAGRNHSALERVAAAGGERVITVALSGAENADADALRSAAAGGAQLALDMVGNATDANATMATLKSLGHGGRHVLMGSLRGELPLPYLYVMTNNLELIGNFMHPRDALSRLTAMAASGLLPLDVFTPKTFGLANLKDAMDAASRCGNLEGAVLTASNTEGTL